MNSSRIFFMPPITLMGQYAIQELGVLLNSQGFKKAFIVTDKVCVDLNLVQALTDELCSHNIEYVVFDEVKPNPTERNIKDGLKLLEQEECDLFVSFGGGSAHDCAKGIALVATNGGHIRDYSLGVHLSSKPQLPLVTVNTTAGTASEMTIFAIVTHEEDQTKYPVVDKHMTPIIAVNDCELMVTMPKPLTAATGMDALTHAVEAYVSTAHTPVTDACALQAIELIAKNLIPAYENGKDRDARNGMQYAEYLAGMAFSNASLGFVHSMAHQLGGVYDLAHGLCNVILLPHVSRFNAICCPERFCRIATALGVTDDSLSVSEKAEAGIVAIEALSKAVGTDQKLKDLGVKADKLEFMSINALKDACSLTNPKQGELADIVQLYKLAM